MVLGVSTVIAGAGMQTNMVLADTATDSSTSSSVTSSSASSSDTNSTTGSSTSSSSTNSTNPYEQAENDEKVNENLQAYKYPVVAAKLTIKKGEALPAAQDGVQNWSSLPAGTTAVWHKEPTVDQVGESFGTVIVTFPDQSASVIAVYLTVEGDGEATSIAPKSEVNAAVAKAAKTASSNGQVDTTASANDQVVVKDVKTEYNSTPTKKSQATDNAVAKSNTSDAELPETQGKTSTVAIISGVLLAIVGLGVAVINKFRTEK